MQKKGTKSRRIADQIPVTVGYKTLPKFVQTEQSVVVYKNGAFVVKNIAEKGDPNVLVGVIAIGPILKPAQGVEKFSWDNKTHSFKSDWSRNDVVPISMVPAYLEKSDMVLVNGYNKGIGWNVTGMDWKTGKTIHQTIFGSNNAGN